MTIEFYMAQGIAQANEGNFSEAIAYFNQAIKLRPDPDVYYNLAVLQALLQQSAEAKVSLQRAIELRADFFDAYNNLGVILKADNDLAEAAACFRRAIQFNPQFAEAYNNLGLTQVCLKHFIEAEACYCRAIELLPNFPEAYNNLGLLQMTQNRFTDAAVAFRRAIALNSHFAVAYNNLAVVLRKENELGEAKACLDQALLLRPDYPEAYYNLGLTQTALNKPIEATAAYYQAIKLRSNYPEAYNNLGAIFKNQSNSAEAETLFRRAIELNPDYAEAYNNLGTILLAGHQLLDAEATFRRAIELRPLYAEAYNNLGTVLKNKNHFGEAETFFRWAIELNPHFSEAYSNLGMVLTDDGRLTEAEPYLYRAIELRPDFPEAEYALATLYFLQGSYDKAWGKYESRFQVFHNYQPPIRRWTGEDLTGQKILLFCEQGLGDTLQFMRYVPQVAALAAQTMVWVQQPLLPLLTDSNSAFSIYAGEILPAGNYDFACPLLSLPLVFGTSSATVPRDIPYLRPSSEVCQKWQNKLVETEDSKAYRVGVAWAGNPNQMNDYKRSIPFEQFARLFVNDQVSWVNLQVGKRAQDLAAITHPVRDFSEQFVDFLETAGMIANLDLVITADTSVAHLSGAMGKPTWLLLSFAPDWRWQLGREDSPWYPTMRIFRQREMDNWSEVLQRVTAALEREYIGST